MGNWVCRHWKQIIAFEIALMVIAVIYGIVTGGFAETGYY